MQPKITKKELLNAFECLCRLYGVKSKGFYPESITAPIDGPKYDGTEQWAMKHVKGLGWMIVLGSRGCGCAFVRYNGYIKGRWNFLMLIEALIHSFDYSGPKKA